MERARVQRLMSQMNVVAHWKNPVGGGVSGRQAGDQAVTALADEQVEERANDGQEPDDQQPEHFFSTGEVVTKNHEGQDDMPNDGNKNDDKHEEDGSDGADTALLTCHARFFSFLVWKGFYRKYLAHSIPERLWFSATSHGGS
jgi:hypothetical protein